MQNGMREASVVAEGYDVIILGAGISGIVSARSLATSKQARILVIEEYPHIGGNHIDVSAGGYTFDVGSIVFHANSPFFDLFPYALQACLPAECTVSKLSDDGQYSAYPLSMRSDVFGKGASEFFRTASSLISARLKRNPIFTTRDYAVRWMGEHFFTTSGLEAFIERFHGLDARLIDKSFAEKRMGWIARYGSLTNLPRNAFGRVRRTRQSQAYVRPEAGFSAIYTPIKAELESLGIDFRLGQTITGIYRSADALTVRTLDKAFVTRRVISTIPLRRTLDLCGKQAIHTPPSLSLISLFYSFAAGKRFPSSILYNFTRSGRWKRVTVYSDYYGRRNGRGYFTVELTGPTSMTTDEEVTSANLEDDRFRTEAKIWDLFSDAIRLEGAHTLNSAYPTYPIGAPSHIDYLIKELSQFGIEVAGRQGAFDYLPTAHQVTEAVRQRLKLPTPSHRE